ncbi:MAG TPA: guanylate kinase [Candidatus Saccharimonadales bacterium]|nr:guanylate kinase [Candidatus Saccharimonadales bacterium]
MARYDLNSLICKSPVFPLVVSGPSGVGKTSIVQSALKVRPGWRYSVSTTTRPPRADEISGTAYDFISEEEFEHRRRAGNFLETAEVHGHQYGTPRDRLEGWLREGHVVVLNIDVQGGSSMRRAFPDGVFVFILPPSLEILEERLRHRATDAPEVVARRLENAKAELKRVSEYTYVIVNDDLELATRQLLGIADAEQCRIERRTK